MDQLVILFSGALAIVLTQLPSPRAQRWAPLIGIVGQPFWLWASWHAQQWGMFTMSLVYTGAWGYGIKRHWWDSNRKVKKII